ncbi:MAG: hypothetical protein OXC44_01345 [Proteobacteria bacterium]|nr:hypothetical protein [Pseudomonadota bacterium]
MQKLFNGKTRGCFLVAGKHKQHKTIVLSALWLCVMVVVSMSVSAVVFADERKKASVSETVSSDVYLLQDETDPSLFAVVSCSGDLNVDMSPENVCLGNISESSIRVGSGESYNGFVQDDLFYASSPLPVLGSVAVAGGSLNGVFGVERLGRLGKWWAQLAGVLQKSQRVVLTLGSFGALAGYLVSKKQEHHAGVFFSQADAGSSSEGSQVHQNSSEEPPLDPGPGNEKLVPLVPSQKNRFTEDVDIPEEVKASRFGYLTPESRERLEKEAKRFTAGSLPLHAGRVSREDSLVNAMTKAMKEGAASKPDHNKDVLGRLAQLSEAARSTEIVATPEQVDAKTAEAVEVVDSPKKADEAAGSAKAVTEADEVSAGKKEVVSDSVLEAKALEVKESQAAKVLQPVEIEAAEEAGVVLPQLTPEIIEKSGDKPEEVVATSEQADTKTTDSADILEEIFGYNKTSEQADAKTTDSAEVVDSQKKADEAGSAETAAPTSEALENSGAKEDVQQAEGVSADSEDKKAPLWMLYRDAFGLPYVTNPESVDAVDNETVKAGQPVEAEVSDVAADKAASKAANKEIAKESQESTAEPVASNVEVLSSDVAKEDAVESDVAKTEEELVVSAPQGEYEQGLFSSLLAVMSLKDEAFLGLLDKVSDRESQKLWSARASYFAHLAADLNEDTIENILQREELRFLQGKYQKWQELLNWAYLQHVAASMKQKGKYSWLEVISDHKLAHDLLLYQVPHKLSETVDYELFAGVFTIIPVTYYSSSPNHADSMRDLASRIDASGGRVRSWYEYAAWASKQFVSDDGAVARRKVVETAYYLPVLHHLASLIEETFIEKSIQSPSFEQFRELVVSADSWEEYYDALEASPYASVNPYDGVVDRNASLLESQVATVAFDFFLKTEKDMKAIYPPGSNILPPGHSVTDDSDVEESESDTEAASEAVDVSDTDLSPLIPFKELKESTLDEEQNLSEAEEAAHTAENAEAVGDLKSTMFGYFSPEEWAEINEGAEDFVEELSASSSENVEVLVEDVVEPSDVDVDESSLSLKEDRLLQLLQHAGLDGKEDTKFFLQTIRGGEAALQSEEGIINLFGLRLVLKGPRNSVADDVIDAQFLAAILQVAELAQEEGQENSTGSASQELVEFDSQMATPKLPWAKRYTSKDFRETFLKWFDDYGRVHGQLVLRLGEFVGEDLAGIPQQVFASRLLDFYHLELDVAVNSAHSKVSEAEDVFLREVVGRSENSMSYLQKTHGLSEQEINGYKQVLSALLRHYLFGADASAEDSENVSMIMRSVDPELLRMRSQQRRAMVASKFLATVLPYSRVEVTKLDAEFFEKDSLWFSTSAVRSRLSSSLSIELAKNIVLDEQLVRYLQDFYSVEVVGATFDNPQPHLTRKQKLWLKYFVMQLLVGEGMDVGAESFGSLRHVPSDEQADKLFFKAQLKTYLLRQAQLYNMSGFKTPAEIFALSQSIGPEDIVFKLKTGILSEQLEGMDMNSKAERDKVFNYFEDFLEWYVESYQKEAHLRNYSRDLVYDFVLGFRGSDKNKIFEYMEKQYDLKRERIKKDMNTMILLLQAGWIRALDANALD